MDSLRAEYAEKMKIKMKNSNEMNWMAKKVSQKCNVKYSSSDMMWMTGMNDAASEVAMVACRVCTRLIHLNFTHNSITK